MKHFHGNLKGSAQISDSEGTPVHFNDAVMNHHAHSFCCMKDIQKDRGMTWRK